MPCLKVSYLVLSPLNADGGRTRPLFPPVGSDATSSEIRVLTWSSDIMVICDVISSLTASRSRWWVGLGASSVSRVLSPCSVACDSAVSALSLRSQILFPCESSARTPRGSSRYGLAPKVALVGSSLAFCSLT